MTKTEQVLAHFLTLELEKLSPEDMALFKNWKADPCYTLTQGGGTSNLIKIEILQEAIWEVRRLDEVGTRYEEIIEALKVLRG